MCLMLRRSLRKKLKNNQQVSHQVLLREMYLLTQNPMSLTCLNQGLQINTTIRCLSKQSKIRLPKDMPTSKLFMQTCRKPENKMQIASCKLKEANLEVMAKQEATREFRLSEANKQILNEQLLSKTITSNRWKQRNKKRRKTGKDVKQKRRRERMKKDKNSLIDRINRLSRLKRPEKHESKLPSKGMKTKRKSKKYRDWFDRRWKRRRKTKR